MDGVFMQVACLLWAFYFEIVSGQWLLQISCRCRWMFNSSLSYEGSGLWMLYKDNGSQRLIVAHSLDEKG